MNISRLEYLFERFYNRSCTEAEKAELQMLLQSDSHDAAVKEMIDRLLETSEGELLLSPESSAAILKAVWNAGPGTVRPTPRVRILQTAWFRYAAAIILLLGIGTAVYVTNRSQKQIAGKQPVSTPGMILPGGSKAVLTLADGSTIVLDSAANGVLAQQGNVSIKKSADGQLAYHPSRDPREQPAAEAYNTITTPKGGQYQVLLPDGTKVWLNAESSIRFPTAFSGKERYAAIKGEVYLEVANHPKMPFIVSADKVEIHVLGTSFNVNAYPDEGSVNTTLIEGKVRVTASKHIQTLVPGQQAQVGSNGGLQVVSDIDTDEVMAWKNGYFYFKHADIKTVMRQLARWYDMTVEYRGAIPDMKFGGDIPRDAGASDVLRILEKTKLHFTVEGKKVIVKP